MQTNDFPPAAGEGTLEVFHKAKDAILQAAVARSMQQVEYVAPMGEEAENKIRAGFRFTLDILESAMASGKAALLEDQMTWSMDRLPHDGVSPAHVMHNFGLFTDIIGEKLPKKAAAEVTAYFDWMIQRMQGLIKAQQSTG